MLVFPEASVSSEDANFRRKASLNRRYITIPTSAMKIMRSLGAVQERWLFERTSNLLLVDSKQTYQPMYPGSLHSMFINARYSICRSLLSCEDEPADTQDRAI